MNRYKKANEGIHAPEELKEALCRPARRRRPLWAGVVAAVLVIAVVASIIFWPSGSPLVPAVSAADAYEPDYATPYDGAELTRDYLAAIRQFAARAAGELLTDSEDSTAYSPTALYTALSMVTELTDGDYLAALLNALGTDSVDALRTGTGDLWRYLCANPDTREPGKVTLANSLWLSDQRQYNGDTLKNLADYYYVASYTGDMVNDIPDLVSQWVQKQTNGLLDCHPETDVDTAALLLSAIYFYDEWVDPFHGVLPGRFQTAGGEYAECNYMDRKEEGRAYYQGNGVTAAVQPFQNGGKMLFILPDEGNAPSDVLADTELLASLLAWEELDKKTGTVDWLIPRFTLESTLDLKDGLTALGLGALFDESSNTLPKLKLAGSGNDGACISQAQQGTAIAIDEKGCEAASYVEIMATDTAEPFEENAVYMHLTRPFVFAILSDNDVPLFVGVVNQP